MDRGVMRGIRRFLMRRSPGKSRLGIALGGGGARGLAHIPFLELLDEMGIRPSCISGTSIGAVIGALYASGMSGSEIRELVDDTVISKGDPLRKVLRNLRKVAGFMDLDLLGPGILKGSSLMEYLYEEMRTDSFSDLEIPLRVVATDFWNSREVVISSGSLKEAVKASMGLPAVFTPVEKDGTILIDGGGVNPVPWSALDGCDVTVAVDVLGESAGSGGEEPGAFKSLMDMFDIMQRSIVSARMKAGEPDIYIRPDIIGVGILEFHRAEEIYRSAGPSRDELRRRLNEFGFQSGRSRSASGSS